MIADELRAYRERVGASQKDFASELGLAARAYQDLENSVSPIKPRHVAMLERLSLRLAVQERDLNLALPSIRKDAIAFARLLEHGND